ncbi:MAG TPA: 2'-5' RNA ligase family protein [Nocardioidaceae bacterium]|nr:2'-5' RNA ligase family protein [Nocardioidaceae bacterium]
MEYAMQSALIVTIPEAEDAVAQHRDRFDDAAAFGIPAHVTVIFPFMPPSQVNAQVIESLAAAISTVPKFQATFESTGWFGTNVLWLAPNPAAVFGALITATADAFPDYPPYEGRHEVVVPHLTVGHADAAESGLQKAEEQVRRHLPIRVDVTEVALWCGTDVPGGWRRMMGFPLG